MLKIDEIKEIAERNGATVTLTEQGHGGIIGMERTEIKTRPYAIAIVDLFEDLLSEHEIYIPDEDREGNEEEACLYGATYYDLEDAVTDLLHRFAEEIQQNMDAELVDSL